MWGARVPHLVLARSDFAIVFAIFMLLLRSSLFVQKRYTRAFMGLGSSTVYKTMSIFDHTVQDLEGKEVALSQLRGAKAYLVVNVASQ